MANKDYKIPLLNVDSEHCAMIVDKGLSKVADIQSHNVALNNQEANITVDENDAAASIATSVKEIRDLGYDVATTKANYPVLNMSCASCAGTVENAVKYIPGVVSDTVNFANANLQIEYIPSIVSPEKIQNIIQQFGYDIHLQTENDGGTSIETIRANAFKVLVTKMVIAIVLSAVIMILAMTPMFMHAAWSRWLSFLLSIPVVFYCGLQFHVGALKQFKHKSANMDTLVSMSTLTAFVYSVIALIINAHHLPLYFESASVVIAFVLLGKILEEKAKGNTSNAIKELIGLQAKSVTVIHEGGHMMEMPIETIKDNMILLAKPGEKIAVDGVVIHGNSFVNESTITGEPIPVEKKEGNKVYAGTINQNGSFQYKATAVGAEMLLSQIIEMVKNAQGSKAPIQKLVDKIAAIFVPVVIVIAFLTLIIWAIFGKENALTMALTNFVSVLVIACPCALGLATPTAIMVAMGKAAQNGILVKDAESLQIAEKIDTLIVDKTGTITTGKPAVQELFWLDTKEYLPTVLNWIEQNSQHPLAQAIVQFLNVKEPIPQNFQVNNISGEGVEVNWNQHYYFVRNLNAIQKKGITITEKALAKLQQMQNSGNTISFFVEDNDIKAIIGLGDTLKENSAAIFQQLEKRNISVIMLTGDNEFAAAKMAKAVGIGQYAANQMPADKAQYIKELQNKGQKVAMLGDGINDSAALATADLGIAIGDGSDIAIQTAQISILGKGLENVPKVFKLSHLTNKTIQQNLFWAFVYNIIGIPIAAGVLYPINGFLLNPMIAGAAMALSSVCVVSNSILLRYKQLD